MYSVSLCEQLGIFKGSDSLSIHCSHLYVNFYSLSCEIDVEVTQYPGLHFGCLYPCLSGVLGTKRKCLDVLAFSLIQSAVIPRKQCYSRSSILAVLTVILTQTLYSCYTFLWQSIAGVCWAPDSKWPMGRNWVIFITSQSVFIHCMVFRSWLRHKYVLLYFNTRSMSQHLVNQ